MYDKFRRLAANKRTLHLFQQGYEFCNDVYVHGWFFFNGLLCKAGSSSAIFVFIIKTLPDLFLLATDPVSRNRCTKSVIIDAFGAVSPGYFC
ncbi:hypothetical protein TNCV_345781 [Trichonephila clavipes]|nr:hypothetical protein TNCV_345781 [Trichonephila clavipes]